jgi:hypothetical protein
MAATPFDYQDWYTRSGGKGTLGGGTGAWNGGAGSYGQYNQNIFDLTQRAKAAGGSGYGPGGYAEQLNAAVGGQAGVYGDAYNNAINYFNAGGGVGWQPGASDFNGNANGTVYNASTGTYSNRAGAPAFQSIPTQPVQGFGSATEMAQLGPRIATNGGAGGATGSGSATAGGAGGATGSGSATAGGGTLPGTGGGDPISAGGQFSGPNPFNFGVNDGYQFAQQPGGYQDPSYAWRLAEGEKALQGSAAARGGLLSGATLKGISDYAQNAASQEYNNAFNRFSGDRSFNYGVDNNDRNFSANQNNLDREFGYNAQRDDRNFNYGAMRDDRNFNHGAMRDDRDFNYGTMRDMMNFGMQGTQGLGQSNNWLATLLSQNALGAGAAAGQGAMGGSNDINNIISQMLQQYMSQQMVNKFA